jgi:hypothetical protein
MLSPVTGNVSRINTNSEEISIILKTSFTQNYGLFLPLDCEISKVEGTCESIKVFNKFYLKNYNHHIAITSKTFKEIEFTVNCTFSVFKPRIWTMAGDIGTRGANLGFLPFGGMVEIKLPSNTKVLVSVGDNILSSQTILASINKEL